MWELKVRVVSSLAISISTGGGGDTKKHGKKDETHLPE
jgi:hypothetical protein